MPRLPKGDPHVVYMGPDKGPFQCGHCTHFRPPQDCEKVTGAIDPGGCCNLYAPMRPAAPTLGAMMGMPSGGGY